jgi:CheY-like chemotaxis protein
MSAGTKPEDQLMKLAADFLAGSRAVVADTVGAARAGVGKTLVEMGMKTGNLTLVGDYALAVDCIKELRPNIVVADHVLGPRCGIDLCQVMRDAGVEPQGSLFIIVTGNASESAVAQAAEEEVDAYVLKPYTLMQFKKLIATAAQSKLKPSAYLQKLADGKKLLAEAKMELARACFEEAVPLHAKPALAYFYKGNTELQLKLLDEAQKSFDLGLSFNEIHYKCLTGQFDLLTELKKFPDAYGIARRISKHFPLSPKRLSQALRLAVMTANYSDIAEFYELFKALDTRGEELNKYMCAALVVSARFFFRTGDTEKALDFARKAAVTAGGGGLVVLRDITLLFLEYKQDDEAGKMLKRFSGSDQNRPEYLVAKLAYDNATLPDPRMRIHLARGVIDQGLKDPLPYEVLIRAYLEIGKPETAQEWAEQALALWPDKKERFAVGQ